jgi:hypothetical protein
MDRIARASGLGNLSGWTGVSSVLQRRARVERAYPR